MTLRAVSEWVWIPACAGMTGWDEKITPPLRGSQVRLRIWWGDVGGNDWPVQEKICGLKLSLLMMLALLPVALITNNPCFSA